MLYETSARKPGSSSSKPVARPAQQGAKPQPAGMAPKKPQSMAVAGKAPTSAAHPKQQVVKGFPSRQQGAPKSHKPTGAAQLHPQKMTPKGQTAVKPGHTTVKGWPHHQPGVHKPLTKSVAGYTPHKNIYKGQAAPTPGLTTVTGLARHHKGIHKPMAVPTHPGKRSATVTGWAHHRKGVHKPIVVPTQPGKTYKHTHGRPYYYPGTRKPVYYNGNVPDPTYVNVAGGQPPVQTTGWGTNGSPQAVPAGCPPPQRYGSVSTAQDINVPSAPPQQVCHTCGGTKGCITLSRFAFNSAQIKPRHQIQLKELAARILSKNITTLIATGHTDSSGTEDYNQELGEKRAHSVIRELKKQLSILKPNGHKHLFWQTDSKGETQPISKTNPANNRRVEICLRRGKILK